MCHGAFGGFQSAYGLGPRRIQFQKPSALLWMLEGMNALSAAVCSAVGSADPGVRSVYPVGTALLPVVPLLPELPDEDPHAAARITTAVATLIARSAVCHLFCT